MRTGLTYPGALQSRGSRFGAARLLYLLFDWVGKGHAGVAAMHSRTKRRVETYSCCKTGRLCALQAQPGRSSGTQTAVSRVLDAWLRLQAQTASSRKFRLQTAHVTHRISMGQGVLTRIYVGCRAE